MWGRVGIVLTDVLKERIAFIFRAEEYTQAKNRCDQVQDYLHLITPVLRLRIFFFLLP
jgi:hypothetical protein